MSVFLAPSDVGPVTAALRARLSVSTSVTRVAPGTIERSELKSRLTRISGLEEYRR